MSNKLVLICDNEISVHEKIGECLKQEGMDYISAYNGLDALEKVKNNKPDLVLMELIIPEMIGTDVCREIRKNSDVPIIILTTKSETIDKIIGLELGADDYITKPFYAREVVTRIKTVLRRSSSNINNHINCKDIEINLSTHEVYIKGKPVESTSKEIKILYMLVSNRGKILERDYILSEVWGYDYLGDTRVVDTQIKRLRRKLSSYNLDFKIKSVYGVGYKFEVF